MEIESLHRLVSYNQELGGNAHLKSAYDPYHQQNEDVKASSIAESLRVRKPYTITKQRERWTEEEHKKFLEALLLYRRNWRRIKEHIGTKTTVQIRSHAQKFFSKVARDESSGALGAIPIPPPRPKRKPMHPYPRKLGSLPNGYAKQLKSLPHPAICKPESSGSATSMLTVVESETLGLPIFSIGQNSSSSAAAGSNIHVNRERSSTVTVEEDNELLTVMQENQRSSPKSPSIKLFGKIITAVGLTQSLESGADHTLQFKPTSSVETMSLQEKKNQNMLQMKSDVDLLSETVSWKSYAGLVAPLFYHPPFGGGNYVDTTTLLPPCPWWPNYRMNYYPLQTLESHTQYPSQSPVEPLVGYEGMQVQGSRISTDIASINGGTKDTAAMTYKQINCSNLTQRSTLASRSGNQGWSKNYAPSRRCAFENKLRHCSATTAGINDLEQQERLPIMDDALIRWATTSLVVGSR